MTSDKILFILVIIGLLWWLLHHRSLCEQGALETKPARRPWHFHPRTPKDCPHCQGEQRQAHASTEIIPWSQVKSKRGRRKALVSEGYACPNCIV